MLDRRGPRPLALVAASLLLGSGALAADPGPPARPEVVGTYNGGRLVDGAALPLEGPHHYALYPPRCYTEPRWRSHYPDPSRTDNRYGHPTVVAAIEDVAARVHARAPTAPRLPVGELSNATGGKIPFHLSHQNGLDVDIWFLQRPVDRTATARDPVPRCSWPRGFERRNPDTGDWEVDPALPLDWNWALAAELAARRDVKIIFVGALVERALDDWARSHGVPDAERRRTLAKLYPVYCKPPRGVEMNTWRNNHCPHDDHFHARFRCPRGNARCR